MSRPVNPFREALEDYWALPWEKRASIAEDFLRAERDAFEKGVDAGRKWGHEEKDGEWRAAIRRLLAAHTEQFRYGGERIIPAEDVEALL